MRDRFLYFIVLSIGFLCLSCNKGRIIDFQTIDNLLVTQPDSALVLLSEIDKREINNRERQAKFALMLSEAYDKTYHEIVDDSLIRIATSYYSLKKTSCEKMKSWYYLGIVQKNAGDYSSSIISFEKAEKEALLLNNIHYIGLINRNKADIFNRTLNPASSISYLQKAISAFNENQDSLYAIYASYSLGVAHLNNLDIDEARERFHSVLKSSNIRSLVALSEKGLALSYVLQGDSIEKALSIYAHLPESYYHPLDYGYHALALSHVGKKDSAEIIVNKSRLRHFSKESLASLDFILAQVDSINGSYKTAFSKVRKAASFQDSLTRRILQQSISSAQRDYYQQEVRYREASLIKQRIILLCVASISVFAILLVTSCFLLWKRRRDGLLKEMMGELMAKEMVSWKNNGSLVGALFFEKVTHLSSLANAYYTSSDESVKDRYFSNFKENLRALQKSPEIMNALEKELNLYCADIMTRLRNQVPMSEKHYRVVSLFFAGVPDKYIQLIIGSNSSGSLRTMRSRLRDEIKRASAPDESLFLEMLSTNCMPGLSRA